MSSNISRTLWGVPLQLSLLILLSAMAAGPMRAVAAGPEGGLDNRGWEMVSPVEKNGGAVEDPGAPGAASFQAALAGGGFTYGSPASFGEAEGAPPVSQYLSLRGEAEWSTLNLSPPLLSGTYSDGAFQLFSADLSRALLTNGWTCRSGGEVCEAENPSLSASAPPGYRDFYLHEGSSYVPLVTRTDVSVLSVSPAEFHIALEGASPDLRHVVFSAASRLYEWNEGEVELLSATPGAALAAPSGAISTDGSRVYFSEAGNLYLREGSTTVQVDEAQGGGAAFQVALPDGSLAFFTKSGHLYRYSATGRTATDLTPGGGVTGVLAASGAYVYYLTASGPYVYHEGLATKVAVAADASDYPPATATVRTSADGSHLAFLSSTSLTGFPNAGRTEVYLYEAPTQRLICVSCNSAGTIPLGSSTIPGALSAGEGPPAYRPRALSTDGTRLFFDSSDRLLSVDSDSAPDVYEWEAQGTGGCANANGCVGLISSGRVGSARFLDASADGTDVFFLTAASLWPLDIGGRDVYDARIGGGYPEPPQVVPCEGDQCQGPPSAPDDPAPGTSVFEGPTNSPIRFPKSRPAKHHKHHGKKHYRHRARRRT